MTKFSLKDHTYLLGWVRDHLAHNIMNVYEEEHPWVYAIYLVACISNHDQSYPS